jgi:hypothetical protein
MVAYKTKCIEELCILRYFVEFVGSQPAFNGLHDFISQKIELFVAIDLRKSLKSTECNGVIIVTCLLFFYDELFVTLFG